MLIHIPYSKKQYQADGTYLLSLLNTLVRLSDDEFPMTNDERRCKFCVYRSLCDRGITAGQLLELESRQGRDEDANMDIDFSQVDEISY